MGSLQSRISEFLRQLFVRPSASGARTQKAPARIRAGRGFSVLWIAHSALQVVAGCRSAFCRCGNPHSSSPGALRNEQSRLGSDWRWNQQNIVGTKGAFDKRLLLASRAHTHVVADPTEGEPDIESGLAQVLEERHCERAVVTLAVVGVRTRLRGVSDERVAVFEVRRLHRAPPGDDAP